MGATIPPSAQVRGFSEIGSKAVLGEHSEVHSATVEGIIGDRTQVWRYAHVRDTAIIGDDCMIGQGAFVGPYAELGNRVKIQNHADVSKFVVIEDDVFVGAGVRFCNAAHPTASGKDEIDTIIVKRGVSIGANACIVGEVTIGENAVIGANAVVTKDVPAGAIVLGVPGRIK